MFVLSGLDENFDNVFSTIIQKMLTEKVTIDYAKALVIIHESSLERRREISLSPLPSVKLSVKYSTSSFHLSTYRSEGS